MTKEDLKDIKTGLKNVGIFSLAILPGLIASLNESAWSIPLYTAGCGLVGYLFNPKDKKKKAAIFYGAFGLIFGLITHFAL